MLTWSAHGYFPSSSRTAGRLQSRGFVNYIKALPQKSVGVHYPVCLNTQRIDFSQRQSGNGEIEKQNCVSLSIATGNSV